MEKQGFEFGKSTDVSVWKAQNGVTKIRLKENPKSGKMFFTWGTNETGIVSKNAMKDGKFLPIDQLQVVECFGEKTEQNPTGHVFMITAVSEQNVVDEL